MGVETTCKSSKNYKDKDRNGFGFIYRAHVPFDEELHTLEDWKSKGRNLGTNTLLTHINMY